MRFTTAIKMFLKIIIPWFTIEPLRPIVPVLVLDVRIQTA